MLRVKIKDKLDYRNLHGVLNINYLINRIYVNNKLNNII